MTTDLTTRDLELPWEAWALGWAFLAGQLLLLAERGTPENEPVLTGLSMLLGAVVVGWFAAGVLTGRSVRTVLVGVLCVLAVVLGVAEVVNGSAWAPVHLAASVVQLVALIGFCRTDYIRDQRAQRAQRRPAGPPLRSVVGLAIVVGALGGVTAGPGDGGGGQVQLDVGL